MASRLGLPLRRVAAHVAPFAPRAGYRSQAPTTSAAVLLRRFPGRAINTSAPPPKPLNRKGPEPGKNSGKVSDIKHDMVHFRASPNQHPLDIKKVGDHTPEEVAKYGHRGVPHPIWTEEEVHNVAQTHVEPAGTADRVALAAVKAARWGFDTFSLYRFGKVTKNKVLNRAIFLETVAGVPGMTAGMLRHLKSLRSMDHDHGWIHTLLEEAENERMHLLTFIQLKKPDLYFRTCVLVAQGIFMNAFFVAYLISPHFCHRFVGYLEEEAVHTYESILDHIDHGELTEFGKEPAPTIAIDYWRLAPDANMRDLFLAVRADEANHRDVNHTFASLPPDAEVSHFFDHQGKPIRSNPSS
uniref:Alternative oxidase n=1 Tax=Hemiselmis tepida TaxID=464990 RepID=A0A7S0V1I1_9CRYP|mmetsp:Transcript_11249/g.29232  ORF Transcript_11249/g.29232 Transcript_11249/m.29232 type:complete len:354 (+) Transcript_11249:90-1151(+)